MSISIPSRRNLDQPNSPSKRNTSVDKAWTVGALPQHNVNNSTRESCSQPWHPRITPYRILFVLTTLILGTAKAVLIQRNWTVIPVTLEWISGVVLALVFYISSGYDAEGRTPLYFASFFKFDCMDLLWHLLAIRRPQYMSNELSSLPGSSPGHPPITLYRILLNSTVILFGLSKAVLGYVGSSTAVTWLDWCLGTILTTGLYILGLYELNTSNIWAPFFVHDRVRYVMAVNRTIFLTIRIAFCMTCIVLFAVMLWILWHDVRLNDIDVIPTFMDTTFEIGIKMGCSSVFLFLFVLLLRQILPKAIISLPLRLLHIIQHHIGRTNLSSIHRFKYLKSIHLVVTHIILHLLGIGICVFAIIMTWGFIISVVIPVVGVKPRDGHHVRFVLTFTIGMVFFIDLGIVFLAFVCIRSMIRPFYSFHRPYPPEFYTTLLKVSELPELL